MSSTFYGKRADGSAIRFGFDEPGHLDLNIGNVGALMHLLGLVGPGVDPTYGEASMAMACKAVQRARASFEYLVDDHTRPAADGRREGGCRYITSGLDEHGLRDRLDRFADLLCEATDRGATSIYWG